MADIHQQFIQNRRAMDRRLRQQKQQRQPLNERERHSNDPLSCPECFEKAPADFDAFRAHVRAGGPGHEKLNNDADIEKAFKQISLRKQSASNKPLATALEKQDPVDSAPSADPADDSAKRYMTPEASEPSRPGSRNTSPQSSVKPVTGLSPPTPSNRNRNKNARTPYDATKRPHITSSRTIWNPDVEDQPHKVGASLMRSSEKSQALAENPNSSHSSPPVPGGQARTTTGPSDVRHISQEQLVAEVKGIYAALVMVESKCIDTHGQKLPNPIDNGQYRALIALHRTLLHEHHDFFLASQHPTAHPKLKNLAAKYAMPARMWRHGIHSFLEFLRHRLPDSREFMLTFVYIAYQSMGLLYETVPSFRDTWIECLGDLSRYRMAIEDKDQRDRDIWTSVSRHWYSQASGNDPSIGRLHHHLAILARPNPLSQLFYYNKALCVKSPFVSAGESIKTLFEPLLNESEPQMDTFDKSFVRVQGALFSGKHHDHLSLWQDQVLSEMEEHVTNSGKKWLESGYLIGVSLACSMLGFGAKERFPPKAILPPEKDAEKDEGKQETQKGEGKDAPADTEMKGVGSVEQTNPVLGHEDDDLVKDIKTGPLDASTEFAMRSWTIALRIGIEELAGLNTLSFHHTMLVFLLHLSRYPRVLELVQSKVPWSLIAQLLNNLLRKAEDPSTLFDDAVEDGKQSFLAPDFREHGLSKEHRPEEGARLGEAPGSRRNVRPLPDDYALQGLVYTQDYLPRKFDYDVEEDEKSFEFPSMEQTRIKRIVWLGLRIAESGRWLTWDPKQGEMEGEFGVGSVAVVA